MTLSIYHIGTAVPTHSIRQQDAATVAATFCGIASDQRCAVDVLYRRTRIERRGSVLLEQPEGIEPRQTFMTQSVGSDDRGPTTAARMDRYAADAPALAVAASRCARRSGHRGPGDRSSDHRLLHRFQCARLRYFSNRGIESCPGRGGARTWASWAATAQ